jgi:Flp pilus assembly protein TadD
MNTLVLVLLSLFTAQYHDVESDRSNLVPPPHDIHETVFRALGIPEAPQPPTNSKPISVARLSHKVPKKARDAFNRATALAKKEKHAEAVRELQEAVAIDPAFADAYNNLGVQHFLVNCFEDSETALRRALELDPAFTTAHINLAYLALSKNDPGTAEREAQRAIALGDDSGEARNVLRMLRPARQP